MFAIVHAQTKNFVGIWDRRSKLQHVERDEIALGLELCSRPGNDFLHIRSPPFKQRTHGEASLPNSSICTTPRIRARVSDSLLMHDTGVPGTVRTTRPVTYEYHQVHSFMYDCLHITATADPLRPSCSAARCSTGWTAHFD